VFKIDQLFNSHEYNIMRSFSYVHDINPTELAWTKLKTNVRTINVLGNIMGRFQGIIFGDVN